jgi:hypothetical protein
MTRDTDLDRSLDSWFAEGPSQLPEHAIDRIVGRLDETNQRRPLWLPGGQRMNRITPWIGAAAAGLLVVAALVYLNPADRGGVGGAPAATPSPTATPEPSPSPLPSRTPADLLPEGSHVLWEPAEGQAGMPVTVTIPAGWYGEPGGGFLENSPGEQNFAPEDAGMIGPFAGDIYVPEDPCQWSTTMPDTPATTVDEVVAALEGQASRDASEPVDITVDGHAGKSITLHVPDDAVFDRNGDASGCDPGVEREPTFCTLSEGNPADCSRYHQFPGQIDELWILDVDGEVIVIDAMWTDATPAEAQAELQAILESMTFEAP